MHQVRIGISPRLLYRLRLLVRLHLLYRLQRLYQLHLLYQLHPLPLFHQKSLNHHTQYWEAALTPEGTRDPLVRGHLPTTPAEDVRSMCLMLPWTGGS